MSTKTLATVAAAAALAGCATIKDGTTQGVSVALHPPSTMCTVTRDGDGELGVVSRASPYITVSKDKDALEFNCKAPGHAPRTQRVASSTSGSGAASFWFLDLGITDLVTGAMWVYPHSVSITLLPLDADAPGAPAQTQAAAVQTLNVAQGPQPATASRAGQWAHQAARVPEAMACRQSPDAALISAATKIEVYEVRCTGGELLTVRCEWGACRALR